MNQSSHPLAVFLRRVGVSHEDFAKTCGLSQPYISLICARKRRPSADVAKKIERECLRIAAKTPSDYGSEIRVPLASELVFARRAA